MGKWQCFDTRQLLEENDNVLDNSFEDLDKLIQNLLIFNFKTIQTLNPNYFHFKLNKAEAFSIKKCFRQVVLD